MPAQFRLSKNAQQQYRFQLVDSTGEMLLVSGDYSSKEQAIMDIESVKVGSLMSNQFAAGKVAEGDMFFVIRDEHGSVLVKSALYSDRMLFDNALHKVKDNTCIAEIEDLV